MAGPMIGQSTQPGVPGVEGESNQFHGVLGITTTPEQATGPGLWTAGVAGVCDQGLGSGLYGRSQNRHGVLGFSMTTELGQGIGVFGQSSSYNGVRGLTYAPGHGAVVGVSENHNGTPSPDAGPGVYGQSDGIGVQAISKDSHGLLATSLTETPAPGQGVGVWGESHGYNGVRGVTFAAGHGAVAGVSENHTPQAGPGVYGLSDTIGVFGESPGGIGVVGKGPLAGRFVGNIEVVGSADVTGDIRLLNADCAEEFDIAQAERVDPGTVMVLVGEGALCPSQQAYDKRVAGIVSGAGDYKPALVLDRQTTGGLRQPIALIGKVFCKVDAQYGPVEIGDLLTTSPTLGHAMKAGDPMTAFGAVIGKALRPLSGGQALIPVLVALQ